MVACRYGISLLVFNSISHSFATLTRADIELNTRREIPYLRAPMYYSLYKTALGNKFMLPRVLIRLTASNSIITLLLFYFGYFFLFCVMNFFFFGGGGRGEGGSLPFPLVPSHATAMVCRYIQITSWLVSAYDFYSRVMKDNTETNNRA